MTLFSLIALAWRSLVSRRASATLTILSVALAVMLFLGVDKMRRGAEDAFQSTISGTDLIVGARTAEVNLLLYTVFRIGDATNSISWDVYRRYRDAPQVAWTIPLSLGDSHRGFRVLGTTDDYFEHYRYGNKRQLTLSDGQRFDGVMEAVIGATVAETLGYSLGDEIVISHGIVATDFNLHDDDPFTIVGILAPTGTPVDRTVHVTLESIEAIHADFPTAPTPGTAPSRPRAEGDGDTFEPEAITAFLVGMENRQFTLALQAQINRDRTEPLLAVMPAFALSRLWEVVGVAETAFLGIAGLVVAIGLLGLLISILTSLNERRREIAVLRATGARRRDITFLLIAEAGLLAAIGSFIGAGTVYGALRLLGPFVESRYGVPLGGLGPSAYDALVIVIVITVAKALGLFPAWQAYKNSLADGLTVKL